MMILTKLLNSYQKMFTIWLLLKKLLVDHSWALMLMKFEEIKSFKHL
jgi:hypothetical protein